MGCVVKCNCNFFYRWTFTAGAKHKPKSGQLDPRPKYFQLLIWVGRIWQIWLLTSCPNVKARLSVESKWYIFGRGTTMVLGVSSGRKCEPLDDYDGILAFLRLHFPIFCLLPLAGGMSNCPCKLFSVHWGTLRVGRRLKTGRSMLISSLHSLTSP